MIIHVWCYEDLRGAGGVVRHVLGVADALSARGHDVRLCVPGSLAPPGNRSLRRVPAPFTGPLRYAIFCLAAAPLSLWWTWKDRPGLILVWETPFFPWPALWARLLGSRAVADVHGMLDDELRLKGWPGWFADLATAVNRVWIRLSAATVAQTRGMADYAERLYGAQGALVVPCAVNPEEFRPRPRKEALARLGLADPGEPCVGFVGGPHPWHGIGRLLEVASRVARQMPEARFLVAGRGHAERWSARVRELGLERQVLFLGEVPHGEAPWLVSLFDLGWCVVEPIRADLGSPLKLYEYLACEAPALVNPDGFGAWAASTGAAAVLPLESHDEAAAIVVKLLRDPAARREMGRRGREAVLAGETWGHRAAALEALVAGSP